MADASSVQIVIGGRDLTSFARVGRVRIDDLLNDTPNTCALSVVLAPRAVPAAPGPFDVPAFDAVGFNTRAYPAHVATPPPVAVGAPIGIYLRGGAEQIFGGEIVTREQSAEFDQPANVRLDLTCVDFTRRLNARQIVWDYGQMSASALVLDLVARFCPGITTRNVQAGLATITGGITFTWEQPGRALSRIAEKIGAYWYIDYAADLHFFTGTEAGATPAPLVPGGRFADLKISADLTQVRTRIFVEGDGATITLTLPAGDAILPVSQTTPFNPAGGLLTAAPWRLTYTGLHAGGAKTNTTGPVSGGSSGGAPPTPPGAPIAALASAATAGGLAGGPYVYRTTVELADGSRSTLGAPSAGVTIGAVAAPPGTAAALGGSPTKGPIAVGVASTYATSFVSGNGAETAATVGGTSLTGRPVADAPGPIAQSGAGLAPGIPPGWYWYLVTFLTPAGETLGSPIQVNVPTGGVWGTYINVPTSPDGRVVGRRLYRSSVSAASSPAGLPWRHIVDVPTNTAVVQVTDAQPDASYSPKNIPAYSSATDVGEAATVFLPTSPDARITKRRVYRKDGPGEYRLVAEIPDNATGSFADVVVGPGGNIAPTTGSIGTGAVNLSGIAIGPAGTVTRRIFRTVAGGVEYRELTALADNLTTTYLDATPDANLGGSPLPAQGTPGAAGTIAPTPAASATIQVTGLAGFPAAGWVHLEDASLIRYTATSTAGGNFLTGIPAAGPGAIVADIPAGSVVTAAPALLGIAPVLGVTLGDAVQLLVQVDDVPAQMALAAVEGGDGVVEYYIQDRRLSEAGARGRGLAELALFKQVETRVSYTTHDLETKSGRTVHAALPAPTNLAGDFLIQRVTVDDVSIAANWHPRRKVDASTTRFSFDDVLARILLEQH